MKKITAFPVLLVLIFSLSACSEDTLSLVKNGILNIDKSITISQAVSGYSYLIEQEWIKTEDAQGRQYVELRGRYDLRKMVQNLPETYYDMPSYSNKSNQPFIDWCIAKLGDKSLWINDIRLSLTFLVSSNQKDFEISKLEIFFGDQKVSKTNIKLDEPILTDIYANQPDRTVLFIARNIFQDELKAEARQNQIDACIDKIKPFVGQSLGQYVTTSRVSGEYCDYINLKKIDRNGISADYIRITDDQSVINYSDLLFEIAACNSDSTFTLIRTKYMSPNGELTFNIGFRSNSFDSIITGNGKMAKIDKVLESTYKNELLHSKLWKFIQRR